MEVGGEARGGEGRGESMAAEILKTLKGEFCCTVAPSVWRCSHRAGSVS